MDFNFSPSPALTADWWRNWISRSDWIFASPAQSANKNPFAENISRRVSIALNYQLYHQINSHRNRSLTTEFRMFIASQSARELLMKSSMSRKKEEQTFFASIETQLKFNVENRMEAGKAPIEKLIFPNFISALRCWVFVRANRLIALLSSNPLRATFYWFHSILFNTH